MFVAYALASVYIQTADLPIKLFTTPIMTWLVAVCALIGYIAKRINIKELIILGMAWGMAACGDIFIEKSMLATASKEDGQSFMLGVGLFLLAYLIFGVSFSVFGILAKLRPWVYATALVISVIMGVIAYKSLLIPPGQNALVIFYTIQAVILLFGGLLSLFTNRYSFACIGILLFFSDWLVGLRAFGNPAVMPQFITEQVLILILITYYIPMMSSIDYSFKLQGKVVSQ